MTDSGDPGGSYTGYADPDFDGLYTGQIVYSSGMVLEWYGSGWRLVTYVNNYDCPPETPDYVGAEEGEETTFGDYVWEWNGTSWFVLSEIGEDGATGTEDSETDDSGAGLFTGTSFGKRWVGNTLLKMDKGHWLFHILKTLFLKISRFDFSDGFEIRRKNVGNGQFDYYVEKRDFGVFERVWIRKGAWVNVKILKKRIRVPNKSIRIPCIGAQMWVWKLIGGGLDPVNDGNPYETSLFPIIDLDPSASQMNQWYGNRFRLLTGNNVSTGRVRNYLKENGYKAFSTLDFDAIVSLDTDEQNTYWKVRARHRKTGHDHVLILSFETPFDDEYWATYRDASAMDILRDLAVVSNRWIYLDANNVLWFLPRDTIGSTTVEIPRHLIIERDRKREKEQEVDINIQSYKEDEEGKIQSYGLRLREPEIEAQRKGYREMFSRGRIESTLKIYHAPAEISLMKDVSINDHGGIQHCGVVIEFKRNLAGKPLTKIIVEKTDV